MTRTVKVEAQDTGVLSDVRMKTMNKPDPIRLFTCAAFLLSAIAIVVAARGDLWLDEIWSLLFAREAKSIAEVFLRFPNDNNHPLNTLFLYCLGDQSALFAYRIFSVLSGLGSLLIAGYVARRDWGRTEALFAVVLMGTCSPLLLYFSEARGYAAAILFGLAAYATLGLTPVRRSWVQYALFWITSILGMLSHATFLILSFAFALWSAAQQIQSKDRRLTARRFFVLHTPPFLFFAWWYVVFLKNIVIGGGEQWVLWDVIGRASVLILGLPDMPALRVAAPVFVFILVALGSAALFRQHDMRGIFFSAAIVIAPALLLAVTSPECLYFRYFIVCFPFFILLLAYLLGRCFCCFPKRWRWLAFAALSAFLMGQAPRDCLLLKSGRGQYAAALEFIVDHSAGRNVFIGSDHDFRNKVVFDFYAPRVAGNGNLHYVDQPRWRSQPPDWLLTQQFDVTNVPQNKIVLKGIGEYALVKEYNYSGILEFSGWNWFLLKRETTGSF